MGKVTIFAACFCVATITDFAGDKLPVPWNWNCLGILSLGILGVFGYEAMGLNRLSKKLTLGVFNYEATRVRTKPV